MTSNRFTGSFPDVLSWVDTLTSLDLSLNGFNGSIDALSNLTALAGIKCVNGRGG